MGLSRQDPARFQPLPTALTAPVRPLSGGGSRPARTEFSRLEQFAKVRQAPPPVKFRDLERRSSAHAHSCAIQLAFDYRYRFHAHYRDDTIWCHGDGADPEQANDVPQSRGRALRLAEPLSLENQHADKQDASSRHSRTSSGSDFRIPFASGVAQRNSRFTRRPCRCVPGLYKIDSGHQGREQRERGGARYAPGGLTRCRIDKLDAELADSWPTRWSRFPARTWASGSSCSAR